MAEYMTWPSTDGPATFDSDSPINLGTEFVCTGVTWAKGLRVWQVAGVGGPLTGRLYEVTGPSTGSPVTGTDVTFTLSAGWLRADFPEPVALVSGGSYKAVVNFPSGYSGTGGYWATGPGSGGIVNGPLTTPDTAQSSGGQGTFAYGGSLAYPTGTFNGGNYWVDVIVTDSLDGQVAERDVTLTIDVSTSVEVVKRAARLSGPSVALVAAADVMAVRRAAVATTLPVVAGSAHVASRHTAVTLTIPVTTTSTQVRPGERHGDYQITPLPTRLTVTPLPSRWTVLEA